MSSSRAVQISLLVAAGAALVSDHGPTPWDELFSHYGAAHDVPRNLLRAIARVESSLNPAARSPLNSNGTRDYGLMQINSSTAVLMKRDVARLLEADYSIETAALLLASIRRELGDRFDTFSWAAAYNAGSPAIRVRGIFNVGYVSQVVYHLVGYDVADVVSGRA